MRGGMHWVYLEKDPVEAIFTLINILVWSVLSLRSNLCRSSFEWMSRAGISQITWRQVLLCLIFCQDGPAHLLERDELSRSGEDRILDQLLACNPSDLEDLKVANQLGVVCKVVSRYVETPEIEELEEAWNIGLRNHQVKLGVTLRTIKKTIQWKHSLSFKSVLCDWPARLVPNVTESVVFQARHSRALWRAMVMVNGEHKQGFSSNLNSTQKGEIQLWFE